MKEQWLDAMQPGRRSKHTPDFSSRSVIAATLTAWCLQYKNLRSLSQSLQDNKRPALLCLPGKWGPLCAAQYRATLSAPRLAWVCLPSGVHITHGALGHLI